jgi:hypothetical protein
VSSIVDVLDKAGWMTLQPNRGSVVADKDGTGGFQLVVRHEDVNDEPWVPPDGGTVRL